MKKLLYTLIILVIADCTLKIDNWACQWLSQPLPISGVIHDIKFFNANSGIIAMYDDVFYIPYLYRATNGGSNWVLISNKSIFTLQKIYDSTTYVNGRTHNFDEAIFRTYD